MNNFEFYNPVKIIFGKDQLERLPKNIQKNEKILLIYGSGSIKNNGVYDSIIRNLQEYDLMEFSGIEANPRYETCMKAVEFIKTHNISFLLAAGGGSVIDATKFISAAALFTNGDPWNIIAKKEKITSALPFGSILTLPATGSEMNSGAVIERNSTGEKFAFSSPLLFPAFSILLPDAASTLPKHQVANGVIDAFVHVLEQYITFPTNAPLQDRFAESILQTLIEVGPKAVANPADYEPMSTLMWCATMALNGLIGCAVPQDWAIHMIGHELTVLFNIDHGKTLAIIAPSHYRYNLEHKKEKLAQFAERVWGINTGKNEQKAMTAINKMELFFNSLGVNTRLSEYTDEYKIASEYVSENFKKRGWLKMGENKSLTPNQIKEIVEMSY